MYLLSIIDTPRLILRQWKESDLSPMVAIHHDPKVGEFFFNYPDESGTVRWIEYWRTHFAQHGFGFWVVEEKATGTFIGALGLNVVTFEASFTSCVEIGWR